jgi:KTSC domain
MLRRWLVLGFVSVFVVATIASAQPSSTPAPIVSHIPRQRVESSAIATVGYSKRRKILEVEFVNGAVYRYLDVPGSVYRDLMSAESKARFYDSKIKGHYRSILVRERKKSR